MKPKVYIAGITVIGLLCWCTKVNAVEIKGTVRAVSAGAATIAIEGESAPNVGDPVEIYFKLPGAEEEISVGSGKVTAVRGDSVEANIDKATGTVSKDQLARITSAKPQKRGAVAAAAMPTATPAAPSLSSPRAPPRSTNEGRDPSFAFVDMNKVFKYHPKTKEAEVRINESKDAAKKEFDQRIAAYRTALDEINALNRKLQSSKTSAASKSEMTSERDRKITEIQAMEREINEWRTSREKELKDKAREMREEIVAEINSSVKQLAGDTASFVLDLSGNSLNGVPLFMSSPPAADMSDRVIAALKGQQAAPVEPMRNVKIALVNMDNVFKQYSKTKTAEAEVNAVREAARKGYDERAAPYRELLAKYQSASDAEKEKIAAKLKTMEREINEWRAAKETDLQTQSLKKRAVIVDDITKVVNAKVASGSAVLVMDPSGNSVTGVPLVVFSREIPDLSEEVVTALNTGSGKASATTTPLASSTNLRFACINMDRAVKALPEFKEHEAEINDLREKTKAAAVGGGASTGDKKEKEIQETARQRYTGMIEKIRADLGGSAGFNIIFDATGNSLNGVPVVLFTHGLPDLTDEVISRLTAANR